MKGFLRSKLVLIVIALVLLAGAIAIPLSGSITRSHAAPPVKTLANENWAGYISAGTTYHDVQSTWTVPTAHCVTPLPATSQSAAWVGIGGFESKRIEQVHFWYSHLQCRVSEFS